MIKQFAHRPFLAPCILAFLVSALVLPLPAWAERPWQDATHTAHVISDARVAPLLPHSLVSTDHGQSFALDSSGHLIRLDKDGTTTPVDTRLPTLTVLTTHGGTLWAITQSHDLIHLDPSGSISARFALTSLVTPTTRFSALQIGRQDAFIADDGNPALAVFDLATGKGHRFLQQDRSLTGHLPFLRDGRPTLDTEHHVRTGGNVQMLQLDARGQWLFYQTPTGPLYRIDSALLTDPNFSPVEQIDGIVEWRKTPTLGGLVLTPRDVFYMPDVTDGALLSFGPDRTPLRLLRDSRLLNTVGAALIDSANLSVAVTEPDGTHILRIALP